MVSQNKKERERRIQILLMDRIVFRYRRRIAREIKRVMNEAATLVRQGAGTEFAGLDHREKMGHIMLTLYRDTIETFTDYFLGKEKAVKQLLDTKGHILATPIVDRLMAEWVALFGAERVTMITDTTKRDINRIVENGIVNGLSELEIAKEINKLSPIQSMNRSLTIARTEAHAAANATGFETAKAIGLEMVKIWVAAQQIGRTRESHLSAHNRYSEGIGLDDLFEVGASILMYPGDPRGSAAEIINCRCALVYEFL